MTGRINAALAVASGFLAGVLLVAVLGAGRSTTRTDTVTRTVTVAGSLTTGGTVIVQTPVPDLVGQHLDVAKARLARAKFDADVHGGGLFGVVEDGNWSVAKQRPAPGTLLEQGSSVRLDVERR
jgi:hypothetical protein